MFFLCICLWFTTLNLISAQNCTKGFYYNGSEYKCQQCKSGFYCPNGDINGQFPCPSGTYSENVGQSSCKSCPAGYYCKNPTEGPQKCTKGYYSYHNMSSCLVCLGGFR